ncbi:MAG: Polyamine-transporting ATPase [Subtercola sp.]|nr:Polyamine-transporting ATPase [Subtercola sp.]
MSDLVLKNIVAGYKGTDVLREIDLEVKPGMCIGVLGANGAGKSTLLRTISGQLKIRGGSRTLGDLDTTNWRAHKVARAGVRWVGDPRPIYPSLTVEENLDIGGTIIRSRVPEKRDWVYNLLPVLAEKRNERGASLSGGQQQMLAIGQALMSEPTFLCLDEPSLGLAAQVITSLSELIGQLAASGVGIVWAEQFPEVAMKRCTDIVVLGAGKVVLSGPPSAISSEALEAAYLGKSMPGEVEQGAPAQS